MPVPKIADVIRIQGRFLRSANLQRDFRDPIALDGYVVTDSARNHLRRMVQGLPIKSGRRSWRITGDYGSGKSSFALLVAHCFAGKDSPLPPKIRRVLDVSLPKQVNFLPILITGSREPIAFAVLRSLSDALERHLPKARQIKALPRINELLSKPPAQIQDNEVLDLIVEANSELIARGQTTGMLIILDELGKFLEFAALHPERQDVFFLQQLGEISARSGSKPLFTIGLLHQGFSAYADQLSQSAQREWEKIGGRFEELLFSQPLEQVSHLLAAALDVSKEKLPRGVASMSKAAMKTAINLGWYGTAPPITALTGIAPDLYPLNPTVIPILVKFFSKFGQNERSLFSFLLSTEPFGLQDFAQQAATADSTFRIHHLFDYAAANFGNRLSFQTYRNHWNHIESLVRSFPATDETEVAVLKTVGLLNLLNVPDLVATEEAIALAISDPGTPGETNVRQTIHRLNKDRHVLYQRGRSGGYFLWSHTSVNLEAAYEDAGRAVSHQRSVAQRVKDYLDNRPIVARRHYIQTGNLRHFDIQYCSLPELETLASSELARSDGRIIVPLVETPEQVQIALQFAMSFTQREDTLIGVTEPLGSLAGLMMEAERWTWVQKHTPELKDDRYAAEEVGRQLTLASQTLEKRIRHFTGLGQSAQSGASSIRWFFQGKEQSLPDAKSFISYLSQLCDNLYRNAPSIHNEIVNRRTLSSAAASARMRLIERMFSHPDCEYLGMDPDKRPPEMSIYLSLLKKAQLHVKEGEQWKLQEPPPGSDPCRLRPALNKIREILTLKADQRIPIPAVMDELRRAPFGIRDGVLPILLVLTLLEHQHEIALYEKGTFLSQVGKEEILRLTKAPQIFELQLCEVQGLRRELFDKISGMLDIGKGAKKADILAVIRPLCVFAAKLPEYSRHTQNLSSAALAVRSVLLSAREPGTMLFRELPEALGLDAFVSGDLVKGSSLRVQDYVKSLRQALDTLKMALPQLKDRICKHLAVAFDRPKVEDFQSFRDELSMRAQNVLVQVPDMDLKAFCFRLFDNNLSELDWIESVGSLVATTPPSRWKDSDEETFARKLTPLVRNFRNVESILFSENPQGQSHATYKVELTNREGKSKDLVVCLAPAEQHAATELEKSISALLAMHEANIGLQALSSNVWRLLKNHDCPHSID
jgi:hypothetical protein